MNSGSFASQFKDSNVRPMNSAEKHNQALNLTEENLSPDVGGEGPEVIQHPADVYVKEPLAIRCLRPHNKPGLKG